MKKTLNSKKITKIIDLKGKLTKKTPIFTEDDTLKKWFLYLALRAKNPPNKQISHTKNDSKEIKLIGLVFTEFAVLFSVEFFSLLSFGEKGKASLKFWHPIAEKMEPRTIMTFTMLSFAWPLKSIKANTFKTGFCTKNYSQLPSFGRYFDTLNFYNKHCELGTLPKLA